MKYVHKTIVASLVFIFGIGTGWVIKGDQLGIVFTPYLPALATLLAAYFGAKYAFDLQSAKDREITKQRNIGNGNVAIFNILRMINNLLNYQRQIIDPVRDKQSAFLEMSPTLPSEKDALSINVESLSFLFVVTEPNILGELSVGESKYQRTLEAIVERSRIHREEVQPTLEEAGIVQGGDYTFKQIELALGNRLFTTLQESTNQIIEHVDGTILSLQGVATKLSEALLRIYPNETIIRISIQPSPGSEEKTSS
jgi:hypothetical protein